MNEQTEGAEVVAYDFTFTGACGCMIKVKSGKEQPHACVAALTDAFMAAWDVRVDGTASEHAVRSMRTALRQTGWLPDDAAREAAAAAAQAEVLRVAEVNALTGDDIESWLSNPFMSPDMLTEKVCWWITKAVAARESAAEARGAERALLPIRRFAEAGAVSAKALGHGDRDFLDLIILCDRELTRAHAALVAPSRELGEET